MIAMKLIVRKNVDVKMDRFINKLYNFYIIIKIVECY